MIRDTAAQDQVLPPSTSRPFKRGVLLILVLAALLLAIVWVARGWLGGSHSVDSTRLRTAQVVRGDLVRDIAADGVDCISIGALTKHVRAVDLSMKLGPPPVTAR